MNGLTGIAALEAEMRDRLAAKQSEIERHVKHKREAHAGVKNALSLCQHTPEEWAAMTPELRDFKHQIIGALEISTLNLSWCVWHGPEAE